VLAVALLLGSADPRATVLSVGLVALVAWLLATVPGQISGHGAWAWLRDVVGATPATPLQLIYLLIVGLIALPRVLGVEILMGAILAGLVMRRFIVGPQTSEVLKHLEASSYGLFVPLFFVVAGSRLDLASVVAHPWRPLLCFMGIVVIRGLPQFLLYRRTLPDRTERLRFCLLVSQSPNLPIVMGFLEVQAGLMSPQVEAALVGGSLLSVLLLPALDMALRR